MLSRKSWGGEQTNGRICYLNYEDSHKWSAPANSEHFCLVFDSDRRRKIAAAENLYKTENRTSSIAAHNTHANTHHWLNQPLHEIWIRRFSVSVFIYFHFYEWVLFALRYSSEAMRWINNNLMSIYISLTLCRRSFLYALFYSVSTSWYTQNACFPRFKTTECLIRIHFIRQ